MKLNVTRCDICYRYIEGDAEPTYTLQIDKLAGHDNTGYQDMTWIPLVHDLCHFCYAAINSTLIRLKEEIRCDQESEGAGRSNPGEVIPF